MGLRRRHPRLFHGLVTAALLIAAATASAQQPPMRTEKSLRDEYPDFKNPRRAGANRSIVTICAGFPWVLDRNQLTGASGIVSDPNLTVRSHGTDGSIEILRGSKGDGDITWKVGTETKTLTVRVIDCREKPKTTDDPPKLPPPTTPGDPPLPPFPPPPKGFKTPTHRTARCSQCFEAADRLNIAIDKFNQANAAGQTYPLGGLYADVLRLAKELDACEKKCAGVGMRTKVFIGAGAAATTALAFAGGGDPKTPPVVAQQPAATVNPAPVAPPPAPVAPTPSPAPAPAPAPTPTQPDPTGAYTIRLTVTSDPAGHDRFTFYSGVGRLDVQVDGTTIRITGPFPWVTVTGTYTPATGGFIANGTGTVAGNNNVPVSVTGTFSGNSLAIGQVQVGPTNLPGNQAELLSGSGTKQ